LKTPIGVRAATSRSFASDFNVVLGRALGQIARTGKVEHGIYISSGAKSTRRMEDSMAFKPNYGRDRAERQRAARARTEEKQRRKDEKALLRKAERDAAEAPPSDKQD
jgi:hypothetical protein